jgi:8-oxo-dGTP diphosphatase
MDTKPSNENELPQGYDPAAFDRPSVTVDVVAFTARKDNKLQVLLIERGVKPFEGQWALPGGFVQITEDLDAAAARELGEETGVMATPFLEQLYTFGKPGRDPRTRVITVAYYALLPASDAILTPQAATDAKNAKWWALDELPALAFDHAQIIEMALTRLRAKLAYTHVAYALLPEEFTLTELQTVYEMILSKPLDKRNFRKKMAATGLLKGLDKQKREGAHRPAQLFVFTKREPIFLG